MAKELAKIIVRKKATVVKKWFDLTAQTYAPDTAEFLKSKTDPFANPVGVSMLSSLDGLLDQLIHDMDPQRINSYLDPIIRIRAVQNFTPSQAVAFILYLKEALRMSLTKELRDIRNVTEFSELESKIDRLSLMAFDIYMQCREKIYQLSANEMKNRTFRAFERAGLVSEKVEGA
jgi:protoporphyrinogen oxidase